MRSLVGLILPSFIQSSSPKSNDDDEGGAEIPLQTRDEAEDASILLEPGEEEANGVVPTD